MHIIIIINKLLGFFNLEIKRKSKETGKNKWKKLEELPKVQTIIDIGVAKRGTPELYCHFPDAHYLLVDPLESSSSGLEVQQLLKKSDKNIFIPIALGSQNTKAIIGVRRRDRKTSFFSNKGVVMSAQEIIERREVNVKKLDDLINELSLTDNHPFGIKIDTEGYEMEVLKGATETLQRTIFAIIEYHHEIIRDNKPGYNLQDIVNFMNNKGFITLFFLDGKNVVFINNKIDAEAQFK